MRNIGKIIIAVLIGFLPASSADGATIRIALHWLPQAQFAGYYVALEKGFYKNAGLTVEILPGGPDSVPAERLSSTEAHFATMFLAAAIEHRMAGIPLVNLAQTVQHSALMIVTIKRDAIQSIEDLDHKKISMWDNEFVFQPWALFRKRDIKPITVPTSGSLALFLRGAVTATLAMWYNEYHVILTSGYTADELQPFFFKDTEFDFPEDGLYCLEKTIITNPTMVKAVVAATMEGWAYAFTHKQEALDIVEKNMLKAKLPVSRVHQRWMLDVMEQIMMTKNSEEAYGRLGRRSFATVMKTILETGFSDQVISYEDFVWED